MSLFFFFPDHDFAHVGQLLTDETQLSPTTTPAGCWDLQRKHSLNAGMKAENSPEYTKADYPPVFIRRTFTTEAVRHRCPHPLRQSVSAYADQKHFSALTKTNKHQQ